MDERGSCQRQRAVVRRYMREAENLRDADFGEPFPPLPPELYGGNDGESNSGVDGAASASGSSGSTPVAAAAPVVSIDRAIAARRATESSESSRESSKNELSVGNYSGGAGNRTRGNGEKLENHEDLRSENFDFGGSGPKNHPPRTIRRTIHEADAAEVKRLVQEAIRLLSHEAYGKPVAAEKRAAVTTLGRAKELLDDTFDDGVTVVATAGALLRKVARREAVSVALMTDLANAVRDFDLGGLAQQVLEADTHRARLTFATRLAEQVWRAFTAGTVPAPFEPCAKDASTADRYRALKKWKQARRGRTS